MDGVFVSAAYRLLNTGLVIRRERGGWVVYVAFDGPDADHQWLQRHGLDGAVMKTRQAAVRAFSAAAAVEPPPAHPDPVQLVRVGPGHYRTRDRRITVTDRGLRCGWQIEGLGGALPYYGHTLHDAATLIAETLQRRGAASLEAPAT